MMKGRRGSQEGVDRDTLKEMESRGMCSLFVFQIGACTIGVLKKLKLFVNFSLSFKTLNSVKISRADGADCYDDYFTQKKLSDVVLMLP